MKRIHHVVIKNKPPPLSFFSKRGGQGGEFIECIHMETNAFGLRGEFLLADSAFL